MKPNPTAFLFYAHMLAAAFLVSVWFLPASAAFFAAGVLFQELGRR